jgi:hypothetical protein
VWIGYFNRWPSAAIDKKGEAISTTGPVLCISGRLQPASKKAVVGLDMESPPAADEN